MNGTLDGHIDKPASRHGDDGWQVPIEDLPVEIMDLYFMEGCVPVDEPVAGPPRRAGRRRDLATNTRRRRARSRLWRVSYL